MTSRRDSTPCGARWCAALRVYPLILVHRGVGRIGFSSLSLKIIAYAIHFALLTIGVRKVNCVYRDKLGCLYSERGIVSRLELSAEMGNYYET